MKRKEQEYRYRKNQNEQTDREFEQAGCYGKVRLGEQQIFWKRGFVWYKAQLDDVVRAYRRVEEADARMCCGSMNFDIQKLMLVRKDGTILELLIGDGTDRDAKALFEELKQQRPEIAYGKQAD